MASWGVKSLSEVGEHGTLLQGVRVVFVKYVFVEFMGHLARKEQKGDPSRMSLTSLGLLGPILLLDVRCCSATKVFHIVSPPWPISVAVGAGRLGYMAGCSSSLPRWRLQWSGFHPEHTHELRQGLLQRFEGRGPVNPGKRPDPALISKQLQYGNYFSHYIKEFSFGSIDLISRVATIRVQTFRACGSELLGIDKDSKISSALFYAIWVSYFLCSSKEHCKQFYIYSKQSC